jgi:hypothetical protein
MDTFDNLTASISEIDSLEFNPSQVVASGHNRLQQAVKALAPLITATESGEGNATDVQCSSSTRQKGTVFDETIDLRDPAGHLFMIKVMEKLQMPIGRGRRENPENAYKRLRAVLANGIHCRYHRDPASVFHYRKDNAYGNRTTWLSGRRIGLTVDLLEQEGLVTRTIGWRHHLSTYEITPKLMDIARDCGVTVDSLTLRLPAHKLVRLYGPKPKRLYRGQRRKANLIDFWPTPETERMVAELQAMNEFLVRQDIVLALSPEDEQGWTARLNKEYESDEIEDRGGALFRKPELIKTDLYRVFNNGSDSDFESFDQGGRLYGGFWINTPKHLRPKITINGQPTVELDYPAYHINMLYNERGLDCEGYAYDMPEIVEYERKRGLKPRTYKSCIKQYTQAMVNCKKGGRPSRIKLKEGSAPLPDFDPIEIIRMIERRHSPIKDAFRSNAGLRLQRIDSDIAMEVITAAKEEGWVALPVHDSFIATVDNQDKLKAIMEECYWKRFNCGICVETPLLD